MRKDGIQTRKRKQKKGSGSGGSELSGNKKDDGITITETGVNSLDFRRLSSKDYFFPDVKPNLSHHHNTSSNATDRNANTKMLSSPSNKIPMIPSSSTSRTSGHQSSYNLTSTVPSNTHLTPATSLVLPSGTLNATSKYDLGHATSGHLTHPTSATGYIHPNNLGHQSAYGTIKSETNHTNYDYMNNCLQNSYFGSTFGSLAASAGTHTPTDLAGYHHQHNVIQSAKLMASS